MGELFYFACGSFLTGLFLIIFNKAIGEVARELDKVLGMGPLPFRFETITNVFLGILLMIVGAFLIVGIYL